MVQFSSYTSPMDRDYGKSTVDDNSTNDVGIGVQDIGQGVPMGIAAANVQGVAAKMKAGAGALEIQFIGAGRGQRNAQTPGMYGKEQREALRELAEINEVNLTTHASTGVMGLAGMDQQGNFSDEQRKFSVDEIKRAVAFAADTAKGGSVVVHTGEFQRPISEESWAYKDPDDPSQGHKFKQYEEEPEGAVIRVIDDRTGQVATQVRKNQEVTRPVWLRSEKGEWREATRDNQEAGYKTGERVYIEKDQYVDYEGNPITRAQRVPEYDEAKGRFNVKKLSWQDFVDEAEELNEEREKELGRQLRPEEKVLPEEAYVKATLETNAANAKGWALYYGENFERAKNTIGKLRKAYNFYKKLEEGVPEEEKWKLKQAEPDVRGMLGNLVPPEYKLTSEIIHDKIKEVERNIEQAREASSSQETQASEAMETMEHVKSARKYALDKSYNSYAEAGVYAFEQTRHRNLKNPLMITMENIFPESYGGHPDELMNLISGSRKKMAKMLQQQKGMSEAEAKKTAEEHIKATLDTGHLNVWRKYWQDDPDKTFEQNDNDFKEWMLNKVEKMAKKNMVGNVHLADNNGYQDEHLTPGDGTTPVKEIVKTLKKHGYKGALTVEPGAAATTDLSDFHGLMKTWKLFGSPVYGAHGPVRTDVPKDTWTDIHYSFFGQGKAPYYIFGTYSPSQDWTLWTQVPLE